jgi:hypothetical protein
MENFGLIINKGGNIIINDLIKREKLINLNNNSFLSDKI